MSSDLLKISPFSGLLDFNSSLSAFVPKGSDVLDEILISRDAADTRPLAMKNSDNKIVGSVFNDKMKSVLSKQTCKLESLHKCILHLVTFPQGISKISQSCHKESF